MSLIKRYLGVNVFLLLSGSTVFLINKYLGVKADNQYR